MFIQPLFNAYFFQYLDPGSGSLIIQLLLAAVLGIGVATRIYWKKIRALFMKPDQRKEDNIEAGNS